MFGCNLKNYGGRTMNGNWWEERVTLQAHLPPPPGEASFRPRDMDVDTHVRSYEASPKWQMNAPSVKTTTYQDATNPDLLENKAQYVRRIHTAEDRHRLAGTATLTRLSAPGSTTTARFLSTQFTDPHKMTQRTVYQKSYCNPEFEATLQRGPLPPRADTPRRKATESSWTPGWGTFG
jgi:hypothetical protein